MHLYGARMRTSHAVSAFSRSSSLRMVPVVDVIELPVPETTGGCVLILHTLHDHS